MSAESQTQLMQSILKVIPDDMENVDTVQVLLQMALVTMLGDGFDGDEIHEFVGLVLIKTKTVMAAERMFRGESH